MLVQSQDATLLSHLATDKHVCEVTLLRVLRHLIADTASVVTTDPLTCACRRWVLFAAARLTGRSIHVLLLRETPLPVSVDADGRSRHAPCPVTCAAGFGCSAPSWQPAVMS